MNDDVAFFIMIGGIITMFVLAGQLGEKYERRKWCAHEHEAYNDVLKCEDNPDYEEPKSDDET